MNRRRLYLTLCDEIAQGWPAPWWPQDREAAEHRSHGLTVAQDRALCRYLDLVAEVAA